MELQSVCQSIVGGSDGVLACGLVDLDTGLMLAEEHRTGVETETEGLVRSADLMFRGPLMGQFVAALSPRRSLTEYVKEAQITTADTRQYLSVLPGRPNTVLVLITKKAMSIGLGWMLVRQSEGQLGVAERPPEVREAAPQAGAVLPEQVRADRAAQVPAQAASAPPRTEPRIAAAATTARAGGQPRAATGARGHRAATSPDKEADSSKEPAEATKPVTRVGARAFFRQKT